MQSDHRPGSQREDVRFAGDSLLEGDGFELPSAIGILTCPKHCVIELQSNWRNPASLPQKTGKLKEFVPTGGSERISLHDEGLPPGLILGNV
jgi:hypothetical protein